MSLDSLKEIVAPYLANEDTAISRLFSYQECFAFKADPEAGFNITLKIANHFKIPFRSVYYVGSAQLGHSLHKNKDFQPGISDLDVAIIDEILFIKYLDIVNLTTNNFTNRMGFEPHDDLTANEVAVRFEQYLVKGYFRPDYMPKCPQKREWAIFFDKLQTPYTKYFKRITCGIYASSFLFNSKQRSIIKMIKESK